jgi:hypothetical protein
VGKNRNYAMAAWTAFGMLLNWPLIARKIAIPVQWLRTEDAAFRPNACPAAILERKQ